MLPRKASVGVRQGDAGPEPTVDLESGRSAAGVEIPMLHQTTQ